LCPRRVASPCKAFATGALSIFAHSPVIAIRDFDGHLQLDLDTGAEAALRVKVKAESLQVTGNVRPQDREEIETRMRQEVLETMTYPEVAYETTEMAATKVTPGWFRLRCRAKLTLHGVSNPLELDSQLRINDEGIRLSGEFSLLPSAYRIKRVSALGGMITVKDELKFSYDIAGRKQTA
jgi:polyisoprenoid-binding protein YceI